MTDPELLAVLRAAPADSPDSVALRLHLGQLLVDDDPAGALEQCTAIVAREPDHAGALTLAAEASQRRGDADRAERYRRMAEALGLKPSPPVARWWTTAMASTRLWFEVARSFVLFADESGVCDDLLGHLRKLRMA